MALRFAISTPKVDQILKNRLSPRKFNMLAQLQVKPIYIELKYTFFPSKLQLKRFYKPSGKNKGNKSYLIGHGEDKEGINRLGLGTMNKLGVLASILGTAVLHGVCWVGSRKEIVEIFFGRQATENSRKENSTETKMYGAPRYAIIPISTIYYVHRRLKKRLKKIRPKELRRLRFLFAFAVFCTAFHTFNELAENKAQIQDFVSGLWIQIQTGKNPGMTEFWYPLLCSYSID